MKSIEELDVFKLAHETTLEVYQITRAFPEDEKFGLTTQMRRAAFSIPMNLAEGAGRLNTKEYRQFVGVARGSASELRYQVTLARDLGYLEHEIHDELHAKVDRIGKMLTALSKALSRR
ncbi:MAG: four helix bundle protein [Thermodesulfobacteriota bacterium]